MKVWKNLRKLWKHSPAARIPTAFHVLPNFHSCFYNSIESRKMFLFLKHQSSSSVRRWRFYIYGRMRVLQVGRSVAWDFYWRVSIFRHFMSLLVISLILSKGRPWFRWPSKSCECKSCLGKRPSLILYTCPSQLSPLEMRVSVTDGSPSPTPPGYQSKGLKWVTFASWNLQIWPLFEYLIIASGTAWLSGILNL